MTKEGSLSRYFRRGVSRRNLVHGTMAAGAVLGTRLWKPARAFAQDEGLPGLCDFPVPIPHVSARGTHFYFAGPVSGAEAPTDPLGVQPGGRDPSVIFNFKGIVGQGDFNLTGTGTDLTTGATDPYTFHTDTRFMSGAFVGTDGVERNGSFAFI